MKSITWRRILKFAGYPLFFLIAFGAFLFWTFPVERFRPAVEKQLKNIIDREVRIEDMSLSLTGDVVLSGVQIQMPAEEAEEEARRKFAADEDEEEDDDGEEASEEPKPKPALAYHVDEMAIDVGYLGLLLGELDVEVELDFLGGDVSIAYVGPMPSEEEEQQRPRRGPRGRPPRQKPRRPGAAGGPPAADGVEEPGAEEDDDEDEEEEATPLSLVIEAEGLELRQFHDLRAKLPLPITGQIDIDIALSSETGEFQDASGTMNVNGVAIVLGNSEAQIEVGGMPMTVDEIAIAQVDCEVKVEEGAAEFTAFEMRSQDFDAKVQGSLTFSDPLSRSRFDLYLMFRFLEGYAAKSARAQMLISSLDDFSRDLKRAHRSDGYYGFRYRGRFGSARLSPSKTFRGDRKRPDRRKRPRDRKRAGRAGAGLPSGPAGAPPPRDKPRGDPSGADLRGETLPGGAPPKIGEPLEPMPRPGLDDGPARLRPGAGGSPGPAGEEPEEEAPEEEASEEEGAGEEEGGGEGEGAGEEEGSGEEEESGEEEGGGEEEAAGEETE
jgi:hypothetical protein